MKIAFYSDNFYPEISGISDSISILGMELLRRGHEVAYVVPRYPHDKDPIPSANGAVNRPLLEQRTHRIPSLALKVSPTGQSRIALPVGSSLSFIHRFKPDVLHSQSPFGAGMEALYASRIFGIPLVCTNHTAVDQFASYAPFKSAFEARMMKKMYAWYYNRATCITAPSSALLDDMKSYGCRKPMRMIPNPILTDIFMVPKPAQKEDARKKLGVTGPTLLYIGRLANEKHVDTIIRSLKPIAAAHSDVKLIIAGRGITEEKLRRMADDLGVSSHIIWAGYVEPVSPRLVELYQAADIFTMPSSSEIHPLGLMQAFACGQPAIGANVLGFKEYLPPECGFQVDPTDDTALAKHVIELIGNPAKRTAMGAAARSFVLNFSVSNITSAWLNAYEDIHRHPRS